MGASIDGGGGVTPGGTGLAGVSGATIDALSEKAAHDEAAKILRNRQSANMMGGVALVDLEPDIAGVPWWLIPFYANGAWAVRQLGALLKTPLKH